MFLYDISFITRIHYSKLTHYSPSVLEIDSFPFEIDSLLALIHRKLRLSSFNNYVNTFSIQLTMLSKTHITISDLLVNFPCKYDRLSLRTHFSSEYAKLTGKNVPQMAFQGLTTEFLNIFVKKYHRNKQSFYRYETRVILLCYF